MLPIFCVRGNASRQTAGQGEKRREKPTSGLKWGTKKRRAKRQSAFVEKTEKTIWYVLPIQKNVFQRVQMAVYV